LPSSSASSRKCHSRSSASKRIAAASSSRYASRQWLSDHAIKFRPIRPASPHLNGKIERAHQTDLLEFYATVDLNAVDLHDQLASWQHVYNWDRPHSSLNGKTPIDRVCELIERTPLREDVDELFDPDQERFRHPNYAVDLALSRLKRCL